MNLLFGTTWISEDEPCLGLYEINLQSPGSLGFHRYQVIYVMRGDKPAEYREDMGPAVEWAGTDQLRIPGGAVEDGRYHIEETVGRLREMAARIRRDPLFDKQELVGQNNIRLK